MVDESEELDENDSSDDESEVSSSYVANEEKDNQITAIVSNRSILTLDMEDSGDKSAITVIEDPYL